MIKACVIGWPISHSRSPLIHGYWLQRHDIDGSYVRLPVEPSALPEFLNNLSSHGYAGCNVTIPHKENTFKLVTPADESTERIGAVNTVFLRGGQTFGTNTDGEGFINSVQQSAPELSLKNKRAVVLGAGGASLAIVNALLEKGVAELVVANRTVEKAQSLRRRFGSRIVPLAWDDAADSLSECSLLVNTTSLGMKGQPELVIDLSQLDTSAVVTDIVYTPLRTKLLVDAARRGHVVVEGLGMLLHQAVRGFFLWFGIMPDGHAGAAHIGRQRYRSGLPIMIIAGLTGSIAMGKSETAKMFASRGIPVFDSDAAVHSLYAENGAAVEAIRAIAPGAIVDGSVDRTKLAALVQAQPQLLTQIERAVHPLVQRHAATLSRECCCCWSRDGRSGHPAFV